MDFRTTFNIIPSEHKIAYTDKVMFIGSCFATSIGRKFENGHFPVMINPTGTVYNPVSVSNTLDTIIEKRRYTAEDLYNHDGTFVSFDHYSDFSSTDSDLILDRINKKSEEGRNFITGTKYLFITFGTARVYRWKKSGRIVSNCHKIPASGFTHELLRVRDIVVLWTDQLDKLNRQFPGIKVVFTVSPVRHWKDGAHGNQISKSVLLLAVEELLLHSSKPQYFPAYELFMDDLRDYRFYEDDMLHPSSFAIDYIWNVFTGCYFDDITKEIYYKVLEISKAFSHTILNNSSVAVKKFAEKTLEKIESVTDRIPTINLSLEKEYFLELLRQ